MSFVRNAVCFGQGRTLVCLTLIKREEEECDGEEEEEEEEPFRKRQPWLDSASGLGTWPYVGLESFASIFL